MAQQTLDFVIANQVTGLNEIAKLTNSVGALQKATADLNARTAELERMMGLGTKAIKGMTNPLDAASKALRNQRQGMQQAGMQVNDFVTSISTGASPVQAFNQQIGQLGYAMSMMGGVASKIGNFLAGPWSILVIGASMALGALWENSKGAEGATIDLEKALDFSKMTINQVTEATEKLSEANLDLERTSYQAAAAIMEKSRADMISAQTALAAARSDLERYKTEFETMSPREKIAFGAADIVKTEREIRSLEAALAAAAGAFGKAEGNFTALDISLSGTSRQAEMLRGEMNLLKESAILFGGVTPEIRSAMQDVQNRMDALQESARGSGREVRGLGRAGRGARKELSGLDEAMAPLIEKSAVLVSLYRAGALSANQFASEASTLQSQITMTEASFASPVRIMDQYLDRINKLARADQQAKERLSKFIEAGAKPIETNFESQLDAQIQAIMPGLERMGKEALDRVRGYTDEMKRSFGQVGLAVSDGFKGMITGAQSFGDAMRGVIQAVIDELFRLFVVQQIVGFFTNTLPGLFGGASPSGANSGVGAALGLGARGGSAGATGGYPAPGKPVMVGERGPELFVPTGSGKIIPNHQLGGGGMVINVDARGSTDPEAVRQQVERGILEAAPSIVAAAEQRTISTLRRPRLAGVL